MPSLRELQRDFAATLFAGDDAAPPFATIPADRAAERIAVYRRALFANYRNALAATYPVVQRLVGAPFFNAAVDAFVAEHPSTSGDLNIYGDTFGAFLAAYAPAADFPYLADVAALEWAQDEANRAADGESSPRDVLAELTIMATAQLPAALLTLAPSCRLVDSRYPILRIWQANQGDCKAGEPRLARRRTGPAADSPRAWTVSRSSVSAPASTHGSRPWPTDCRWAKRSKQRRTPTRRSTSARRCALASKTARSPESGLRDVS